ncbi:MAG TPA: hypothetical protein VG871_05615 [Vicinamibacterales bacterium]|nr:hypothetical protein [Vicinamibacterales bacterium]
MLRLLLDLVIDAVLASIHRIGSTLAGVIYGGACVVVVAYLKNGRIGMLRTIAEAVVVGVLLWMPFFLFEMARIPYETFQSRTVQIAQLERQNSELTSALGQRRHYLGVTEPAFENGWGVTMAFWKWRQRLGPNPKGYLVITSDKDPQAQRLASAFIGYAVVGSGFANGNLGNIGVMPEDAEDVQKAISIPDTLVISSRGEVKDVQPLVDALAVKVIHVERRFKMPREASSIPENTLWLHFGRGVRWSSEYWDDKKSK